ncbi:hypothetical protein [Stutzerimonas stutzeri]|uniref:hypothetical protein n=1 Tax=Stutzerimonas stutzeri TaxID=316 RepID=UPI00210C6458|nr:hypothetical protein [Stutzerimonas stutzeri]MCQ4258846.1 hypothetical protein [Stutzerimonas stutzeri]
MKKAAPAKESGLHNMHADYNHHHINDHRQFFIEQVLPLIVGYARKSSAPSDDVILVSFLSLSTILQVRGFSRATLITTVDASRLPIHTAPEGLQ